MAAVSALKDEDAKLAEASSQILALQGQLEELSSAKVDAEAQLGERDAELADLRSQLASLQEQQAAMVEERACAAGGACANGRG